MDNWYSLKQEPIKWWLIANPNRDPVVLQVVSINVKPSSIKKDDFFKPTRMTFDLKMVVEGEPWCLRDSDGMRIDESNAVRFLTTKACYFGRVNDDIKFSDGLTTLCLTLYGRLVDEDMFNTTVMVSAQL